VSDAPNTVLAGTESQAGAPASFANTLGGLAQVHPRRGEKYSENLYPWLAANRVYHEHASVYLDKEGTHWIGLLDHDWFHGTRLISVLCLGRGAKTAAYRAPTFPSMQEVRNFWQDYLRDGRCAIDRAHKMDFRNAEGRFVGEGDRLFCSWCNTHVRDPNVQRRCAAVR
jgi:hypothetical protein